MNKSLELKKNMNSSVYIDRNVKSSHSKVIIIGFLIFYHNREEKWGKSIVSHNKTSSSMLKIDKIITPPFLMGKFLFLKIF